MKIFDKLRFGLRITKIIEEIDTNRRLLREINWANIFNSTISNSKWYLDQSISPGRWAIGYPLLYVLYRILNDTNPSKILEFGLGQSTKLLSQYAAWQKSSKLTTIEHNQEWIDQYIKQNKLPSNVCIKCHDNELIKYKGVETRTVKNLKSSTNNTKYELIIVDAPFGSESYSRPQILELIPNNINKSNFCIIIDDFHRKGEKQTAIELEQLFIKNKIEFKKGQYSGQKDFIVFCSPNLWYILTL